MPVHDPLGLQRCAVCGNAFAHERHVEATRWLRRRRVLAEGAFVCVRCVARAEAEHGPLRFEEEVAEA